MVYVLAQDDPLNCEIPHVDWTSLKFSAIPKTVDTECAPCPQAKLEGTV